MSYRSKKKKIRGWKRRIRQLEEWQDHYLELDLDGLEQNHRDYVKVWLPTFYSLNDHNLPNWYKRQLVYGLLAIYDSWKKTIKGLSQPCYLKIWLFDSHIMNAQVVVSTGSMLEYYDQVFVNQGPSVEIPSYFNPELSRLLEWNQGFVSTCYAETELIEDVEQGWLSEGEIEAIKESAYLIKEQNQQRYYFVETEKVWIGSQLQEEIKLESSLEILLLRDDRSTDP